MECVDKEVSLGAKMLSKVSLRAVGSKEKTRLMPGLKRDKETKIKR